MSETMCSRRLFHNGKALASCTLMPDHDGKHRDGSNAPAAFVEWDKSEIDHVDAQLAETAAQLVQANVEKQAQYDQAVEATQRALVAEAHVERLTAERDEAVRRSAIDESQCDRMTQSAGELAQEVARLRRALEQIIKLPVDRIVADAPINTAKSIAAAVLSGTPTTPTEAK